MALRVLQGIGASAEFGGATLVAVEFARPGRRGLLGSLPGTGAALGGVLGTLMLLAVSSLTTSEQFLDWGWRIPFLLSVVLVGYGIWLRRHLPETPEYRRAEEAGATVGTPIREILRTPAPRGAGDHRDRHRADRVRLLLHRVRRVLRGW
ncbi:MFS transporter [Pseudonocardia sp. RS010]|uniref:MFS transporter n=1 Tax=Pseudonocardia sp. RS010 TaxID=3385979 RepID=UPI00399F2A31